MLKTRAAEQRLHRLEDERITAGAALRILERLERKARHVEKTELQESMLEDLEEAKRKLSRVQKLSLDTEHDLKTNGLI